MKILTNKRYKELMDYENKYMELIGTRITLWTGCRSRYSALLKMSKEELVHRYFDVSNAYIRLSKILKEKYNDGRRNV